MQKKRLRKKAGFSEEKKFVLKLAVFDKLTRTLVESSTSNNQSF